MSFREVLEKIKDFFATNREIDPPDVCILCEKNNSFVLTRYPVCGSCRNKYLRDLNIVLFPGTTSIEGLLERYSIDDIVKKCMLHRLNNE
jgi:hypothetical protein